MSTVALVGLATHSRAGVSESAADEIWTLNWAYNYDFIPRIDRLFEMHPVWLYAHLDDPEYKKPVEHYKWLQQHHGYPVYMLEPRPEVPECVPYPIHEIDQYLYGGRLQKGGLPHRVFTSSFDYMIAQAIYEQWDVIEIYGFEMGSDTEYRYQREGAALYIGQALARGIQVRLPANSVLVKSKLYGYEGAQMIFRQDLERYLQVFTQKKEHAYAKLQFTEGQLKAAHDNGASDDDLRKLVDEIGSRKDEARVVHGACEMLAYLIQHVDLDEPEQPSTHPFATLGMEDQESTSGQ